MTSRPSSRSSLLLQKLPERPDLDQLRRQAKELQQAFVAGDASAVAEVRARYRDADQATFALHDAQLVLARLYGFDSWPKLKARVDGVTAERLCHAVERGDIAAVRKMLRRRPEIVNLERPEYGEQRALHVAVLRRDAVMARVLMEHGADARIGIWPNRDATSPLTIAIERGYDDIVAILEGERYRPRSVKDERVATTDSAGALTEAVTHDRLDVLAQLLEQGLDPDERVRVEGTDEVVYSWGKPLYQCARNGKLAMAEMLLRHGADPNGRVYATGSATYVAYRRGDEAMIALLERYGGTVLDAASVGYLRHTEVAKKMLSGEIDPRLELGLFAGETIAEQLLWSGASGGDAEIVRMSLARIDWSRDDQRWFWMLWGPLPGHWVRPEGERAAYLDCFRQILERCDPNVRAKPFGQTMLHEVVARDHEEGVGFATMLLDAGARTDVRDELLESTPLGWACRWGRVALVKLLLEHGADPVESDAEPWATPRAWAEKMGHDAVTRSLIGSSS